MLSTEETQEIETEVAKLPERRAACIEALKVVQRHRGWVSDEALSDVADFLQMSLSDLDSVATFYNLIFRKPVGRHVILLCDSVSCWILGCDRIRQQMQRELGIDFGETSSDGRFTLLPMQCLGACDHAPTMMVDEDLHQDLNPERLSETLKPYR